MPSREEVIAARAHGVDPNAVAARINEALPGNKVNLTSDLVIDAQERVPALNTFLRVLVGLGGFVSVIFVLLSMYTTVTERRKEIGILKSMGASKAFIMRTIEGEAFLIGVLGGALGLVVAFLASAGIGSAFDLAFEFSTGWIGTAVLIAIVQTERHEYDAGRCAQNMMVAAWSDGVGSCPAHVPEGELGALLGVPAGLHVNRVVGFGYVDPARTAPPRSVARRRLPLEALTHWEGWRA